MASNRRIISTRANKSLDWVIISDVDDTILESFTRSFFFFLLNSFIINPKKVKGMPQVYSYMQRKLINIRFWYISASPYNIFPYVRSFHNISSYPQGDVVLPTKRQILSFLFSTSEQIYRYKFCAIEYIHTIYSPQNVVCIGDSVQEDPEIYGDIYRRRPCWVQAIFIRIVGDECDYRNSLARFRKAFSEIPTTIWYTFRSPDEELYGRIENLNARSS
jgi:phosphatidate phosphatase APP1